MEQHSMLGEVLAAVLKVDRSTACKILKGSRKLTLEHVRRLSRPVPRLAPPHGNGGLAADTALP